MNRPAASLERANDRAGGPDPDATTGPGPGTPGERNQEGSSVTRAERNQAGTLESLVSEAMAMAKAAGGDADLVDRFWRLVPDEDLEGRTPAQMLAATQAH